MHTQSEQHLHTLLSPSFPCLMVVLISDLSLALLPLYVIYLFVSVWLSAPPNSGMSLISWVH